MRSSPSAARRLLDRAGGFAHRGLHGPGIPENSMASFRGAMDGGAGIECDVRLSADGVPVVFHDADLRRMCGVAGRVADLDSKAVGGFRLTGSEEAIPGLSDLLAASGATPLLIELKVDRGIAADDLCHSVAAVVAEHPHAVAAVMSFDPAVSGWFEANAPHVPRGLVVEARPPSTSHADFVAVSVACLADPWVSDLRASLPVATWTVRTPEQRARALVHADTLIWEADGRP